MEMERKGVESKTKQPIFTETDEITKDVSIFRKTSNIIGVILGTILIFVVATGIRGDAVLVLILAFKAWQSSFDESSSTQDTQQDKNIPTDSLPEPSLMADVHIYIIMAILISYVTYFGLGGYLQWYYYIKRRDRPHEWKCQPEKFLTPENERHEIMMGSINMTLGATVSGIIACYIMNGGSCYLYYMMSEYGWGYFGLSILLMFAFVEAFSFYSHKGFHTKWWYKRIHKHHHRYHQPTAFSSTAMHPAEFFTLQAALVMPIFCIPLHPAVYIGIVMYSYYYGMIDHSGIMMDALWPWQPPSSFHDQHHQYFHCNFGFNSIFFDWLHGTLREDTRFYSEETFGGKGAPLKKE
ncbi:uncharacterized protein LOC144452472 [Glandiceps talaboti]